MLSKSQIDRLGERLKLGNPSEDDLRELREYRRSYAADFDRVIMILRDRLRVQPTSRRAKTTGSIINKLQREKLRLSQMQDIAGCRVVVADIIEQNRLVDRLMDQFYNAKKFDRRFEPSHGYRAVHIIVRRGGTPVEIQVRTQLQHAWAEISEKFADLIDPQVKYGGGDPRLVNLLQIASSKGAEIEEAELIQSSSAWLQEIKQKLLVTYKEISEIAEFWRHR